MVFAELVYVSESSGKIEPDDVVTSRASEDRRKLKKQMDDKELLHALAWM